MSAGFVAVTWSRRKIVYDAIVLAGMALFIGTHIAITAAGHPPQGYLDWIDLRLKASGACAFTMLTIILCIGPLARLDHRFLPLLYNRRHFGVLMFLTALLHATFMLEWYVAQGVLASLATELTAWENYARFIGFPFKVLGLAALVILAFMAATSHDYWLSFLGPPVWKALHMAVYVAYGLATMHVALGLMQHQRSPLVPIMFGGAFFIVSALHLAAGWHGAAREPSTATTSDGWLIAGPPQSIPDKAALILSKPGGERIAVFRDGRTIGAMSNLCAHQNGPLGEGCIVEGLVTCPWHGYQYRLEDGCAPAPFTEKLATFLVRLRDGVIEIDPEPLPPGTKAGLTLP
jgi:nitrite reductase/ring-hydroxylating ferredoxin subunit/DMSO/TMAO reductase YedYZ heme-binding membrane subunit